MSKLTGPPNSDRAEMNDIIDHLNSVLDEDEQMARTCEPYVDLSAGEDPTRPGHFDVEAYEAGSSGNFTEVTAGPGGIVAPYAQHITRHGPARVLREVEALQQVINDYRMSDRACRLSDDPGSPEYATIRAGRDAFASVLRAYATATGWQRNV